MVSPDNKIISTTNNSSVNTTDDKNKRKPPAGDFKKYADQIDEGQQEREEDQFDTFSKDKKKKGVVKSGASTKKTPGMPLVSPFELAKGSQDAADEQTSEQGQETLITAVNESAENPWLKKKLADPQIPQPIENTQKTHPQPIHPKKNTPIPHKPVIPGTAVNTKQTDRQARFGMIEQPDLATVRPFTFVPPIEAMEPSNLSAVKTTVSLPTSMQELIDQIADKVYTVNNPNGETQTVLSLKGSFEGSNVIVTQSEGSRGQLNITIDNLTAFNQNLIEAHKGALVDDLLKKGIHVQTFTASATLESARIDVAANNPEGRNPEKEGRNGNSRDGRREQPDDEA